MAKKWLLAAPTEPPSALSGLRLAVPLFFITYI